MGGGRQRPGGGGGAGGHADGGHARRGHVARRQAPEDDDTARTRARDHDLTAERLRQRPRQDPGLDGRRPAAGGGAGAGGRRCGRHRFLARAVLPAGRRRGRRRGRGVPPRSGARADVHHDEHDHHDRQDAPDDDGATPALEGSPAALRDVLARGSGSAHGRVQLGRSHRGRARTLPGDPSRPPQRPDRPQSTARQRYGSGSRPGESRAEIRPSCRFSASPIVVSTQGTTPAPARRKTEVGRASCLFERTYAP